MAEQFIQATYHGGEENLPINRLVIHATCPDIGYSQASNTGTAVNTAHYFQSPSTGGSAHHVSDITTVVRCLQDTTIGYHAPPNAHSLGYEIGGEAAYTREQWLSPQVWPAVELIAAQVKADAAKYSVPLVKLSSADLLAGKRGICGHVDVSQAWHQSDHTDPGPGFPWDAFMALLTIGTPNMPESIVVTPDGHALFSVTATSKWQIDTWPNYLELRHQGLVADQDPIRLQPNTSLDTLVRSLPELKK